MEDTHSVSTLIDSTTSKIQQLQKAFAELEGHRAVTLNFKWKQLEEHFHGLEKSLKRRFNELEDQEKEYETKMMKSQEILETREAAVVTKEEYSLERLQQKRDEAVFSISTVLDKHRKVEPTVVSNEGHGVLLVVEEKPPDIMTTEFNLEIKNSCENVNAEVKCYPQLVKLCTEMDSKGLHKFISDNRKNLVALKEEIPIALKASPSPANLVLTSLEGFYSMDVPNPDGKKDSTLLGVRRTCIMLMECLVVLFTNTDLSSASAIISADVKNLAKAVAEEWKPRLDDLDMDANNGNSLEAHAFLQLLATFEVASDFDQDLLSRLIPMVSRRHQVADLCRSLGLAEKMTGVIDVLKNSGRQIDAVNLAFAFELTEQFPPVPLLKSYLKEVQKVSSPVRSGSMSPTTQNDVNERELTALKAVIKCIEEHNLEEQYPIDPLQKQVIQIEKAKAEKKRANEVSKPQPKRPRASTITYAPRINNIPAEKAFYTRATERYPPYIYDSRPYGYQHGPTPIDNQGHSFNNHPHSHGNYFGNCYQYQVPYLH